LKLNRLARHRGFRRRQAGPTHAGTVPAAQQSQSLKSAAMRLDDRGCGNCRDRRRQGRSSLGAGGVASPVLFARLQDRPGVMVVAVGTGKLRRSGHPAPSLGGHLRLPNVTENPVRRGVA
jgi:hypothetical protein